MAMVRGWLDDARNRAVQPNPNAMTLATIDADGQASARIVLCKGIDESLARFTFFTNRMSRKGRSIVHEARVALVFHWDTLDRQVRIEGLTTPASDAESDAYFQTRGLESKLGAWASAQSEPIASREALLGKIVEVMERFGVSLDNLEDKNLPIPRPPHWGGIHVWASAIELWIGGPGRIHDRARWSRSLVQEGDGCATGAWSHTRLQP